MSVISGAGVYIVLMKPLSCTFCAFLTLNEEGTCVYAKCHDLSQVETILEMLWKSHFNKSQFFQRVLVMD